MDAEKRALLSQKMKDYHARRKSSEEEQLRRERLSQSLKAYHERRKAGFEPEKASTKPTEEPKKRTMSPEARAKISAAMRKRHAERQSEPQVVTEEISIPRIPVRSQKVSRQVDAIVARLEAEEPKVVHATPEIIAMQKNIHRMNRSIATILLAVQEARTA